MKTRNSTVVFVLTMLVMMLVPLLAPEVRAAPTTITLLDPAIGIVGTTVKVEGTIDTSNGTYIIRWNNALNITTGSASGNNVSTSFIVPPTVGAPSGRNITVELIDNSTQTVEAKNFTLSTTYHIKAEKPSPPNQLQEGETTKIWVNVTGGEANTVYAANISVTDPSGKNYTALVLLSNTTTTGYGEANVTYPNDFAAHTNITGTYYVFFNETLATDNFKIGLTDKLEYHPNETVVARGTGYGSLEIVTADIKVEELSVATFPRNLTAINGVITLFWPIPSNVTPGTYNLTLTNATSPGTVKTPPDTQSFEILGVLCQIQTVNLANQPVTGAVVKVYNATTDTFLNVSGETNSSGWIRFLLNSGNYTFKAFWRDVEVGVLSNKNVSQTPVLTLELQLTHLQIVVEDDGTPPKRLSFIDLKLETKYEVKSFRTNATGTWEIYNLYTHINYTVEARRYNLLIPGTPIKNLTVSLPWNNVTIVVPTYTLFVQVFDSKDAPAVGLNVAAYEWSSGIGEPVQSKLTDSSGNVTLSLIFGRYRLRLYQDATFLNEVTVDLIQNQWSLIVHSDVFNIDLSVLVIDYFGQPIPNALVELQRRVNSNYQTTKTQTTGADGIARFNGIVGGDSRIYVSVAGSPSETQYLYVTGPTRDVVFKMDGYVVIAGYALETGQFVTMVVLLILIVAFIIASNYKRLTRRLQRRKK